jgi:hypothetical protein
VRLRRNSPFRDWRQRNRLKLCRGRHSGKPERKRDFIERGLFDFDTLVLEVANDQVDNGSPVSREGGGSP